jgi:secreted Zn-dependent insulinase-like peptidase
MNNIKQENILNWVELKPKYKDIKDNFIKLLDSILSLNCNIIIGSKKFDNESINCDIDNIYKTKFCIDKLKKIKLEKVYDIVKKNKYISKHIPEIITLKYDSNPSKIDIPEKYTFIYNFNDKYKTPLIDIYCTIKFPKIKESVDVYVKTLLYLNCAYSKYSEELSLINNSPYNLTLSLDQNTLYIYIQSDDNQIRNILSILNKILKYTKGTNFNKVKQKYYKSIKSFKNELPTVKISNLISKNLETNYYTPYDTLKVMKNINYETCIKTFNDIRQEAITTIFISGNIEKNKAIEFGKELYLILDIKKEMDLDNTELNDLETPYTKFMVNHNSIEKNSIMGKLYEICRIKVGEDNWDKYIVFLKLLNSIIYTQFFNTIRTKEQLGYIVATQILYLGNHTHKNGFFKFMIQSPIKNGKYLLERTDKFIEDFYDYLNKLNEEEFNEFKLGEISILKDNFTNLSEYNIYIYSHILDKSLMYNYREKIIVSIEKMSLPEFIELYTKYIIENNKQYNFVIDSKLLV